MRRVERRYEIGKGVAIRGLVEAAERGLAGDVELVGELGGRSLREVGDCGEQLLVALFEGTLDALVQLLIAACGLDGPYVTAADDGRIRGIEVEGEVDLFDGQYSACHTASVLMGLTSWRAQRSRYCQHVSALLTAYRIGYSPSSCGLVGVVWVVPG